MHKFRILALLTVLALLTACSGGAAKTDSPVTSSVASTAVISSSSTTTSSTPDSSASSSAATTSPSFTGSGARLIGRFDTRQSGTALFTWPGSAIEFVFEGTRASLAMTSNGQARFQVEVDGVSSDLWVNAGDHLYSLSADLEPGVHRLRLTRLTESFSVVTGFISDPQVDGTLMSPPAAPPRRLLVLGDSITAGYGVEGESQACSYSAATSSQQLAYAALAAKALDADLHTIAWSGIGAWRSYGETTPASPVILERYQRTLADSSESLWEVTAYQPDAILIAIGTNDYWAGSASDDYRLAMMELVGHIQDDYPGKPVYLIASPMLGGATRDAHKAVLSSLVSAEVQLLDLGKIDAEDGYGCDYHPNKITQIRLAEELTRQLKADLNW